MSLSTNLLWLTPAAYTDDGKMNVAMGTFLPGNSNSLETSQTVAMARLSICAGAGVCLAFGGPLPSKTFQSKARLNGATCSGGRRVVGSWESDAAEGMGTDWLPELPDKAIETGVWEGVKRSRWWFRRFLSNKCP